MAVTKIWDIRDSLERVINYAENPSKTGNPNLIDSYDLQTLYDVMNYATDDKKTEKKYYVTGINCSADIARSQMIMTKKRFGKEGGIVAFHAYQSFRPNEVNADKCHKIGIKLAKNLWGDRFEVVVATHLNTNCFHNHFVINSVSFMDGKRYNDCKATYQKFRLESDKICLEQGLSVIDKPQQNRVSRGAYLKEKNGASTLFNLIRADIDEVISMSVTEKQFYYLLRKYGYDVELNPNRKYVTIKPDGSKKAVRIFRLGEDYTEVVIRDRILQNRVSDVNKRRERYISRLSKLYKNDDFKRAIGKSGLEKTYLHYCYLLGILPGNNHPRPVHPTLYDDLKKMDEYIRQLGIIADNVIKTDVDLEKFISEKVNQLSAFEHRRKSINSRLARCSNEAENSSLRTERAVITKQISALRKEINSVKNIKVTEPEIQEKISAIEKIQADREKNFKERER